VPPAAQTEGPRSLAIDNHPIEKSIGMISYGIGKTPKRARAREGSDDVLPYVGERSAGVDNPNNDAVVAEMMIAKHPVKKIMVDSGSSSNILFYDAFTMMNLFSDQIRSCSHLW